MGVARPGFVEFHLLKGPEAEDHTLYASSHTVWENRSVTNQRRSAPCIVGQENNKPLYLYQPQFEGFEVRQTVGHGKAGVA